MVCPICKVEYRPGFPRCADCDVELVDTPRDVALVQEPPEKYGALLWHGEDPFFYLLLVGWLSNRDLACYGRPRNPPVPGSDSRDYSESQAGEFEVWVSESDLAGAKWILESSSQKHEEDPPEDRDAVKRGTSNKKTGDAAGICPLCFGEFATASTYCPNCGVPLRTSLPEGEDSGARELCNIQHPGFLNELRLALRSARIPFNNSSFTEADFITRLYQLPNNEVLVLDTDFERATRVMSQVLQHWEFEPMAGFGLGRRFRMGYRAPRSPGIDWLPADLNFLLWSGANLGSADSIGMALREHRIPYRADDSEHGTVKIFILPDDEADGREIVVQVVEGVSPE